MIAVRTSCAAGAVTFFVLAVDTMSKYTAEVAGVVLAWVWFLFGVVCAIATVQSFTGRYTASLAWCLMAVIMNAATCLYIAGYDWYRTPVHQTPLDVFLLIVVAVEAACAWWLFRRWHASPERSRVEVKGLLALVPFLGLFGAWYSHDYQPHNSAPLVTINAQLSATPPHDGRSTVTVSMSLKNIGTVDAGVVGSLLTVTARGLDQTVILPPSEAIANEQRIATALTNDHVLEPFGDDNSQLKTPMPTSQPGLSLVALDEVTPGYYYLAPDETFDRRFTFDVPIDPALRGSVTLDLNVSMFLVNGVVNSFHPCENQKTDPAYGSLLLQTNNNGDGGYFTCVEASLPARTPIGALVGDHPGLRAYVVLGEPSHPSTVTGQLLGLFSVNGHLLSNHLGASADQHQVLEKFAPTDFAEAHDEIEVPSTP